MPEKTEIQSLVIKHVRLIAEDFALDGLSEVREDTLLYGEGPLDSMALVNLIADLEEAVAGQFGGTIALADERAMSARQSPYRSVSTLTDAIEERLSG